MNQTNASLYPAQNTIEQSSSAPQGFLRASLWSSWQLSTELRQTISAEQSVEPECAEHRVVGSWEEGELGMLVNGKCKPGTQGVCALP